MNTNQLKILRDKYNLTQLKFGEIIGVSERTIQRWEADKEHEFDGITLTYFEERVKSMQELKESAPGEQL